MTKSLHPLEKKSLIYIFKQKSFRLEKICTKIIRVDAL